MIAESERREKAMDGAAAGADEQTFMVRFESMRKPVVGTKTSSSASSRRQLLITHAELRRQCTVAVRGYEFDTRMAANELRRRTMVGVGLPWVMSSYVFCRRFFM